MTEWLSPRKIREDYVDPLSTDIADAQKQLFLAVISGEVRARSKGRIFGPKWLKQLSKMKFDESNLLALPPDIELSVEDARHKWRGTRARHGIGDVVNYCGIRILAHRQAGRWHA
jgi:hypothetical protein